MEAAAGSDSSHAGRIDILGVPLDVVDRSTAFALLHDHLQRDADCLFHLVTLNPEYVMAARNNAAFLAAIDSADLIVADGIGAVFVGRAAGASGIERLTGIEIVDVLAAWSGFRSSGGLFLLGGRDAPGAATTLERRYPAACIRGAWSDGSSAEADDAESLERIGRSGADVVFVGYGAPEQVFWIERNREKLERIGVKVAVGVGGVLDYLSGHASLAPGAVRKAGLEWSWRLVHEPWRWRRQLKLVPFAGLAAAEVVRRRMPYRILAADRRPDRETESER